MTDDGEQILRGAVAEALGSAITGWHPIETGYTRTMRRRAELEDGRAAFVKAAVDDATATWLRTEHLVYREVGGAFLARYLGFVDEGDVTALLLEDLSEGVWPPPWPEGGARRVREALAQLHAHPCPTSIGPLGDRDRDAILGWRGVAENPRAFLSLELTSEAWLERALPVLLAAQDEARLDGGALLHLDMRSDNICLLPGRVVLVDWSWAARGDPRLDLAFWVPSLAMEGGPVPEAIMPEAGEYTAVVSGFFAGQAGRPSGPVPTRVRELQRRQLEHALPWAVRTLDLPPPDGRASAADPG